MLGLLALVLFFLHRVRDKLWVHVAAALTRRPIMRPSISAMHRQVQEILCDLQHRFRAFRVLVFQFHNGDVFMMSDHSWKLTCTHECAAPGVLYTIKDNQNILVSSVTDFIEPIVSGAPGKVAGCSGLEVCAVHAQDCALAKKGHWVLRYDVAQMDETMSKYMAEQQGVGVVYTVNLVSRVRNATFGFIALQFRTLTPDEQVEIEQSICQVCAAAERVQFLLTTKT